MYNLDFADEKSMPCSRMRRFKNFIKNTTVAPVVVREQASEFVEEEHVVPALTADVIQVLGEKGIVETPYYYVHSTHSSRSGKGDAYAIAFAGLLVVMWRKEGECYTVIKLEANEVVFNVLDFS